MKMIILFILHLNPILAFANQKIELPSVEFEVTTHNAHSKLEDTLLNPAGFLSRIKPTGAVISDKKIFHNEISFIATKSYLVFSKSVYVNGKLQIKKDAKICTDKNSGCSIVLMFEASDDLVSDNVKSLTADVCVQKISERKLIGVVYPKIELGDNYSSVVGPKAINLIKMQVPNFISALTEEINLMK